MQHARYPFARINRDFRQEHPHATLCDLAVTGNPAAAADSGGEFHFAGAAAPLDYELRNEAPLRDMVLVHEGQPDGSLLLQWFADASAYEKETAGAWIASMAGWARYLTAGKRVPRTPCRPCCRKKRFIWRIGRAAGRCRPPSPTLVAQVEQWALARPESAALVTESGPECYAALNAASNAWAHALLGLGVARGETVGVFSDRSTSLPAAVLAIWKAGGC